MKKILMATIAAVLILSSAIIVNAANVNDFTDMPDDWSTAALTAAVNNGLLNGSDGMILPKDNLTRAQMAAIIVRAFNAQTKASLADFTDVNQNMWYYEYMQKAVYMQVFKGDGTGLLNPDDNITREQVFAVIARAFKLPDGDPSILDQFQDKNTVSLWAIGTTAAMVQNGYINGANGYINPTSPITRAEFAQVMHNIVKTYIDTPQTLSGTYDGNVIIRSSDVKVAANAVINGLVVVGEGCENVTFEEGATYGNLIDNRPQTQEEGNTPDTPSGTPDASDTINPPPTPPSEDPIWPGETESENTQNPPETPMDPDNSDEGWTTGIYRP